MLKRVAVLLACLFVLCASKVSAINVKYFSEDVQIRSALTLLDDVGAKEIFDNLQENSVKIKFYDLSQISYDYKNHFAINTTDVWGNRYILINTKFQNAPTEQIACLIAHESCHKGKVATLEEETLATQKEAFYWSKLKDTHKSYNSSELLSRLDNLAVLRKASTIKNDLILNKISNSSFYRQQLAIAK